MLGSTTKAFEITGGNRTKAINFFHNLTNPQWPIARLCAIQNQNLKQYDNPVITGFQWKPYRVTLEHDMGLKGIQSIVDHDAPPIKMIFLSRNPLDRYISNIRHRGFQHSTEVPAHCAIDDTDCIARHKAHSKGTTLPTGHRLIKSLKDGLRIDNKCKVYLQENRVQHLSVSYGKLYNDENDVSEWKRVFEFLGRMPKDINDIDDLTMKHVHNAFSMAPTSSKKHVDIIENYDKVKAKLEEYALDYLLH